MPPVLASLLHLCSSSYVIPAVMSMRSGGFSFWKSGNFPVRLGVRIFLAGSVWKMGRGRQRGTWKKTTTILRSVAGWILTLILFFSTSLCGAPFGQAYLGDSCSGSFVPFAFSLLSSALQIGRSKASSKR